jgi:type IV pilus assembly protein PilY1
VSASVPVNAFNRAEVIDNVYLALFQADADGAPFWTGNIKKLKFDYIGDGSGDRQLVDVNGDYAVAADGRIRYDALTFWTDPDSLPPADEDEVDGKDGRATVRGGAGQKIPGLTTDGPDGPGFNNSYSGGRKLYYDWNGDLEDLNVDDATGANLQSALGAADLTEAKALIAYARGLDVNDDDGDGEYGEASEWFSGDPLHSRPLPINFGAVDGYDEDNQKIYIAYGSNDGFMHFIENTTTSGAESGKEIWAFMPQEVMGELSTLKLNASGSGHPYLLDGAPSAYVEGRFIDREIDGEDVFLYFCLRRGGKACYGLDISDPEEPELLWKVSRTGGLNDDGSNDYAELGLTFSDPVVGLISDDDDDTKPIVIFGGGYDVNKDDRSGVGTADTEGAALFVLDGETGELIWKAVGSGPSSNSVFVHADLVDSVPSDVTAFDSDGNQITDRVYFGDTGGRVWRADIGAESTGDWTLTLLADVGRHDTPGSKSNDRRFFHAPDVVQHFDENGPYDAVLIGSGDRPDPLAAGGTVDNFMYMIKDRNIASGAGSDSGRDHADFGDVSNTCLVAGGPCTADLTYGWRLGFSADGEMSLATPLTIGGTSYFSTYVPPGASTEESCGPDEGSGRLYAVSMVNAEAVRNYDTTTEDFERFDDLESKGIPSEAVSLPPDGILKPDLSIEKTETTTRLRTYWYEAEDGTL